ncbi:MAG: acyl carrier protein [Bacteroidales bacterium]|nr:acyl carrier protein [Bacteroidales bacterium]MCF8404535.1 acyl carrier protein [Bacteroidales bacterium]
MRIEDFIERIEEEFEDLEEGTVNADSKFKDILEWNSINALILITLIDSEYDVTLNAKELQSAEKVSDLFQTIKSKVAA